MLLATIMSLMALPNFNLADVITFAVFTLPQVASVSSAFSVSCFKTSCCLTLQRLLRVRGE